MPAPASPLPVPAYGEPGAACPGAADITVVIATRNRAAELCRTLGFLSALPERPRLVVVDNASGDDTVAAVSRRFPAAELIRLPRNRGACARNLGVARAATRYVALSDDDSWWEPGSLHRAAAVLHSHPRLGLVAARTLVGPHGAPDPVNAAMAASPLPGNRLPGPRVLGFLGCAAVVRRSAFLAAGGFSPLLFIGGEEQLLALDLAAAGWEARYVDDVIARHWPSGTRDAVARRRLLARNEVLIAWLRRPAGVALAATAGLALRLGRDPAAAGALAGLVSALPRALPRRRVLPARLEAEVRLLRGAG
jgi:GT2 family glycosyltransferase